MPGILHARLTAALLKEANLVEGSLKTFEVEFELLHAPEADYDADEETEADTSQHTPDLTLVFGIES